MRNPSLGPVPCEDSSHCERRTIVESLVPDHNEELTTARRIDDNDRCFGF